MKSKFFKVGLVAGIAVLVLSLVGCGKVDSQIKGITPPEFIECFGNPGWDACTVYADEGKSVVQVTTLSRYGGSTSVFEYARNTSGELERSEVATLNDGLLPCKELQNSINIKSIEEVYKTQATRAYQSISDTLTDPSSAEYKTIECFPWTDGQGYIVKIEVNTKNKIGGYAGYQSYYFTDDNVYKSSKDRYSEKTEEFEIIKNSARKSTPWVVVEFTSEQLA